MPDDWDETELGWYLVHRAEMFFTPKSDRLRRKAYENALRTRRHGAEDPAAYPHVERHGELLSPSGLPGRPGAGLTLDRPRVASPAIRCQAAAQRLL
jgi:hypothetical protein